MIAMINLDPMNDKAIVLSKRRFNLNIFTAVNPYQRAIMMIEII